MEEQKLEKYIIYNNMEEQKLEKYIIYWEREIYAHDIEEAEEVAKGQIPGGKMTIRGTSD